MSARQLTTMAESFTNTIGAALGYSPLEIIQNAYLHDRITMEEFERRLDEYFGILTPQQMMLWKLRHSCPQRARAACARARARVREA